MYKNNTAGFLLLTCVFYAAILALITVTAVQLSVIIIPQAYNLIQWSSYTDFYAVHDLLYRDFCCAPRHAGAWYRADNEGFIWHTSLQDHGWLLINQDLVYKEGTYNREKKTWSHVTTSLMARGLQIDTAELVTQNGRVHSVQCHVSLLSKPAFHWYCGKVFV